MANNIKVRPSADNTAVTVVTDQIGNLHYPIYKAAYGAEDSATLVDPSNPLPIGFQTDSPNFDSFDRLRVSNPETLFDSKQIFDAAPLVYDDQETSGSGTGSTHSTDTASSTLTVGATTAGKRVRQSFMRFNYQPGKSHLVLCTGVLDKSGGGTGITRGFGYYDDENGLFLQDAEGTIQLVCRSYATGSAVDNAVNQASWNLDTMDGTGASGVTLDVTKTQILIMDFEWLGVGRVRMGFVIDGIIIYAHQFLHANSLSVVYMSTPNLPIRYEIENDGTGAASSLEHICSSVMSEGGTTNIGILRGYKGPALSSLSSGTTYLLVAGRLKSAYLGASILLEHLTFLGNTNDQAFWELYMGGTIAGGTPSFTGVTNGAIELADGNGTLTHSGGTLLDSGIFSTNSGTTYATANALRPGAAIDGTPQEFYLCLTPVTTNTSMRCTVTWRELF